MIKRITLFLVLALLVSASCAHGSDVVPGDVIVVLRNTSRVRIGASASGGSVKSLSAVQSFTKSMNAKVTATFDALSEESNNIFMVIHSDTKDENELLREVRANPNVIAASINHRVKLMDGERLPNDPEYYRLWGMEAIHAPSVWAANTGSSDVYVAVIDSGVDDEHPDLRDYVSREYSRNFVNHTSRDYDPTAYQDLYDHGSHCAGTIAAVGNNSEGVAGVSWRAKIIALRVLSASGTGKDADFIAAFNYLVELLRTTLT